MSSPYIDGLKLLGQRELSEAQVRQRLARREHGEAAIDEAVARLKQERALDDARVAGAIARTQTLVRKRGKLRARQEIERAGISRALAQQAVDDVFSELDPDELLQAALGKRLRGEARIADDAEFRRLYRYLMGQGFESDRIVKILKSRRR